MNDKFLYMIASIGALVGLFGVIVGLIFPADCNDVRQKQILIEASRIRAVYAVLLDPELKVLGESFDPSDYHKDLDDLVKRVSERFENGELKIDQVEFDRIQQFNQLRVLSMANR